ncbi:MAG: ykoV 2 [Planctomycetaceae bacterium]|nr:ykoV 2 [Planctomycetaceae bacterium]
MAMHASWKGHLKISLASVPVQAFTAAAGTDSSEINFNQLHKPCKNRIQYKKFCPIHGEVPMSEIVSGYEYAKGQYIVIEKDELAAIASDLEKSLTIECFVPPDSINPEYGAGQTYYLIPDGRVGQKPYSLINEALTQSNLHGIGEMVISRKQRLVRLRTSDKLIVVDVLHYQGEVRPAVEFTADVPAVAVAAQEIKLAKSLIEQMQQPEFEASQYADDYSARLRTLIEAKLKGNKVAVPQTAQPDVINFMEALQRSVKAVKLPSKKAVEKASVPLKTTARRTAAPKKSSRTKTG